MRKRARPFASSPETFDPTVLDFDNTPGCGDAAQRLREQDQDGIDAEVLFALDVRNPAIRDKAAFIAVIQGFNYYLAEEYCVVDRDRLIGIAVLPNIGAEEDVAELERCKRMGLKGAWLSTFPSGHSYPTPEDDRFWAAALDLEMPVIVHKSFPTKVGSRETRLFKYPREPQGEERPPTDFVQRFARQGLGISRSQPAGCIRRFRPVPETANLLGREQRRLAALFLRADRP